MKVGDVVAWVPPRSMYLDQKVKFVGVVTAVCSDRDIYKGPHVYVIWNESTIPTLSDPRDVRVIGGTNESR